MVNFVGTIVEPLRSTQIRLWIWYINVYHLYGDLYGDLCGFNILYDLYQVIVNEIFMGFYIGLITVYMILSDFYGFLW